MQKVPARNRDIDTGAPVHLPPMSKTPRETNKKEPFAIYKQHRTNITTTTATTAKGQGKKRLLHTHNTHILHAQCMWYIYYFILLLVYFRLNLNYALNSMLPTSAHNIVSNKPILFSIEWGYHLSNNTHNQHFPHSGRENRAEREREDTHKQNTVFCIAQWV